MEGLDSGLPVETAAMPPEPMPEAASAAEVKGDQPGGIDILVDMAKKGDIDAKNIDIIDVTDRFLKAIAAAPKENLRQSGKILFHASVLLRMKAEALLAMTIEEADDFLDFFDEDGEIIYDSRHEPIARQITLQDLERALVRKSSTKHMRQRKVTLEQLIDALREAERIDNQRALKRAAQPRISMEGEYQVNDVEDILELAHDEDIEMVIDKVDQYLLQHLALGDMMSLLELIKLLPGATDWVDAFLACLFLSNSGKITLEQEVFYGPLYLVKADPPPPTAVEAESTAEAGGDEGEAVAEEKSGVAAKPIAKTRARAEAKAKVVTAAESTVET